MKQPVHECVDYDAYGKASHRYAADVDRSGVVDAADQALLTPLLGKLIDQTGYNADYDLDRNGVINAADQTLIGNMIGRAAAPSGSSSDSYIPNGTGTGMALVPGPDSVLSYCGYVNHPRSQMLLARHRWYQPSLGRWQTRDPAGYIDGYNLYAYVNNNPIARWDPTGLWFEETAAKLNNSNYWIGRAAGYVVGGVGSTAEGGVDGAVAIGKGIGKAAGEAILTVYDVGGNLVELNAFTYGLNYNHKNRSRIMKTFDTGNAREMFTDGARHAGQASLSLGTLGAYDVVMGTADFLETGDVDALGGRVGGVIFQNATIVIVEVARPGNSGQTTSGGKGSNPAPTAPKPTPEVKAECPPSQSIVSTVRNAELSSTITGPSAAELMSGVRTISKPPNTGPKTLQPGPYAAESIPARSTARDFTPAERAAVNAIGQRAGCHTCGSKVPGTKSGNFIPDHQPPSAIIANGVPQQLYPHCVACSRIQGGEVRSSTPP